MEWYAVSDLHGRPGRFDSLMKEVEGSPPPAVLMGGDLFPRRGPVKEFMEEFLFQPIRDLSQKGIDTRFLVILGNDDPKIHEPILEDAHKEGLIDYIPKRILQIDGITVAGYPYVHPSPFRLKDWELYDVSMYVDPGCISPLDGIHTVDTDLSKLKYRSIKEDLEDLSKMSDPGRTLYLFHSPPFNTDLDMANIGGQKFDHVPLDPHIGSVAVKRFIEKFEPPVTLHGHVHESYHLTGRFFQRIGSTLSISTCGIEPGLVIIRFDPEGKSEPERIVIE